MSKDWVDRKMSKGWIDRDIYRENWVNRQMSEVLGRKRNED